MIGYGSEGLMRRLTGTRTFSPLCYSQLPFRFPAGNLTTASRGISPYRDSIFLSSASNTHRFWR